MADKDNEKKPRQEAGQEGDAGGKHPDQQRAEREEERTRREEEALMPEDAGKPAPEDSEGEARERLSPESEEAPEAGEEAPEAEGPSLDVEEEEHLPVVGLGASAGGLEALESFFSAVPEESGLAFVVITHTDPEHESMLPDLLKRKSKIPVKLIRDGMPVEPDTVFIPPSDRDPVLENGMFSLKERPARPLMHMPVDLFLKRLAEGLGEWAACVILSGTGTDGTQGLRLIKEKAGLAIVQSPDSARHAGMPKSAIETGLVDYVAAPSDIPERLVEYFKHPMAMRIAGEEKKEPDPLRRILNFLAHRTRHDFSLYKENTVVRRIERRMTITRSRNESDYLHHLQQNSEEVRALFQDLLIGVTNFFRDPDAFDYLKQQVLLDMISRSDDLIRVWIPGCATGEEAFSVAIILKECLEERAIDREVQIFGTDIDSRAIEKARQGAYVQNIASDISEQRVKRFFIKEENRYRIRSDIRDMVVFAEQNVLSDPPFSRLDLLVCRNLLIYLKPEAQNRLIPLFHYAIREDGILFLGGSEGVGRYYDLFEPVSKQQSIYRKKNHLIQPQLQFPVHRKLERTGEKAEAGIEAETPQQSLSRAVEKVLMQEHTPACVVVSREGRILHFHGRTGKYLEPAPGKPTTQIGDMAREGLRFALLSALRRADEGDGEIREKDVQVRTNHEYQRIDLVVKTFRDRPLKDCRLVIFEELPEPGGPEKPPERGRAGEQAPRSEASIEEEIMRIKQDYRSAMEELQTSNEELRSSNEELNSANEELQSTNEELESSREELQSLNEELNTVNNELNIKMEELNDAYNAINAVLNNTRIAIVFLNTELRIRRFTPEATHLLNLIDSDVDRPVDHISHNLEYEHLAETARRVLKDLSNIDEEVRTRDGHWYHMRILVYRPDEHVIEGVVLTFVNIDAQKKAQQELKEFSVREVSSARRFAEDIVDTVRESLLVLDRDMRVVTANRSFYDTFRTSAEQTEGKMLIELGNHQWDIPELKKRLHEIIKEDKSFQDYLVEHRFPEIGFKRMLLNARVLREDKKEDRILLAIEDVTGIPAPEERH